MKRKLASILLFVLILASHSMYAFDVEAVKIEITEQLAKDLKGHSSKNPVLLLIGGYPGAGKTTLITALARKHDLSVISWNAIRQALLDRRLKGSPHDWEIIEAVNRNLLRMCVQRNATMIIDANAYANNIKLFERLLLEEGGENYQIVKICLNPPSEVLLNRVRMRIPQEGVHQGTEKDLLADLNAEHKKINLNDYCLIINNANISFDYELDIINSFLKLHFD